MMGTVIRVPHTTVQFIVGLHSVLVEKMGIQHFGQTEHWTFEKVAEWEECSAPGLCRTHGFSEEIEEEMYEAHQAGMYSQWDMLLPCRPYRFSAYLGVGQLFADGKRVDLRTRIERLDDTFYAIDTITAQVWARTSGEGIRKGTFYLPGSRSLFREVTEAKERMSESPPRRIAFWKKEKDIFPDQDSPEPRPKHYLNRAIAVYYRSGRWVAFAGMTGVSVKSSVSPFVAARELMKSHPDKVREAVAERKAHEARRQSIAASASSRP